MLSLIGCTDMLKIRLGYLLVAVLFAPAWTIAQSNDVAEIERLVSFRLADSRPKGRVAIDTRQRKDGKWGAESDSSSGRRLAAHLSGTYRSLADAISCDASRRGAPGAGCRLNADLDAFIVVSIPEIAGDSALVTISVARPQQSHQDILGDIYYRDETVVFRRRDAKWVFDRVKERRTT